MSCNSNNESNTSCISGCSYAKLGCYSGSNGTMAPIKNNNMGTQIIPVYGAIGYEALTSVGHGNSGGNCSSYFNINDAYGADSASCKTKYVQRACESCQPKQYRPSK